MRRLQLTPRPDWRSDVEALGFDFHTIDGALYWDESAAWELTEAEVDLLDDVGSELHRMCIDATGFAIEKDRLGELGITGRAAELVRQSWRLGEPSLYGRFDLAWHDGRPKLLEYNADTPTSLFEAAVVQWTWLKATHPDADQFNGIHERLVERWATLRRMLRKDAPSLHLASVVPHAEDEGTVRYLEATAVEAGFRTKMLSMGDIGWSGLAFVDLEGEIIERLFKLYPWEWLASEDFFAHIDPKLTGFVEPAWKMVTASKGLLPLLWELFPDHPYLLPASFTRAAVPGPGVVRKPLWGREGSNVTLFDGERIEAESDGPYGEVGWVWQQRAQLLPHNAVLGVWIVGETACGLGIREDDGPITRDSARFIPHFFR